MSRFGGLGLSFGRLGAGSGAGTGADPDVTAPTVSSFSPLDNATDVAVDTDLIVTFDETVVLGAVGVVTLKKTSDNSTLDSWNVASDEGSGAGQLEVIGGNALHLHLTASVANSTEMYVIWDEGVVEDGSANPVAALAVTTTWSFTTEAAPAVNLLTQPSAFDHADWTKAAGSVSANSGTHPVGGAVADEFQENGADDFHFVMQTLTKAASAISYDISVSAKSGGRPRIVLQLDDGTNGQQVAFDLAGGQVGTAVATFGSGFSGGAASIQDETDGWYRCNLTGVTTTTSTTLRALILLDGATGTDPLGLQYTGNNDGTGAFLYDAELVVTP
jgi:hypothetical protein